MRVFLIICGILGALVGSYLLLLALGVWNELRRSRKRDAILEGVGRAFVHIRDDRKVELDFPTFAHSKLAQHSNAVRLVGRSGKTF
jgi:hypothetical protein